MCESENRSDSSTETRCQDLLQVMTSLVRRLAPPLLQWKDASAFGVLPSSRREHSGMCEWVGVKPPRLPIEAAPRL